MIRKGAALVGLVLMSPVIAQSVMVESGRIHLRGQLVNGGCAVATKSQDLRVLMGQYRTNAFIGPGSFAPVSVPFSLRLISCSAEVWRHVGIAFAGVTPAEDPHVFLASGEGIGNAGIGLALFDDQQRQIIPNTLPLHYTPILTSEMTLHFTARYRAISENMTPGRIHSEVWFTLVYP
ncbi:type 1 fimbrial protein subunit FimI [Salmonella enterica]|nr:type 1 fimbrial protein subunit FimI [Salmonella enterica]